VSSFDAYDAPDIEEAVLLAVGVRPSTITSSTPGTIPTEYLTTSTVEAIEDACLSAGNWEYVDGTLPALSYAGKKNEFGESMGMERLLEALKSADWDAGGGRDVDEPEDFDLDDADVNLGDEVVSEPQDEDFGELQEAEMDGMRDGLLGGGMKGGQRREGIGGETKDEDGEDDDDVESLQRMMLKMQAVRDMGVDMPAAQRRKFAADAIRQVMKDV